MTTRYPNSFKEFFQSVFRMPGSNSDFRQTVKAQQPYLYVVIGSIFFVIGGYMEISQRLFILDTIPVNAKVLKIESMQSDDGFVYRPVLEIERPGGSKYQYRGDTWVSPNPHHEGEIVEAHYSQNDGRVISTAFISHTYFLARGFILIGGGAMLLGSFFLSRIRRKYSS